MRVDHVEKYRLHKKLLEQEEAKDAINLGAGHAYRDKELKNKYSIHKGQDLFAPPGNSASENESEGETKSQKKRRKEEGGGASNQSKRCCCSIIDPDCEACQ